MVVLFTDEHRHIAIVEAFWSRNFQCREKLAQNFSFGEKVEM